LKNPWKTISSKTIYKNPWITVKEDQIIHPDGKEGIYSVVERPDTVYIVAMTDRQEIYILGQYRYATQKFFWEVPGGGTEGGDPLEAAKRELKEETGLEAKKWTKVGTNYILNGLLTDPAHIFLAQDLIQTEDHRKEEEGILEVKKVPLKTLLKMIESDQFQDAQSVAAVYRAVVKLGI
jgi:8-oxo-dGTP pyrophosphatase MutT (NUDIX family)